MTNLVESVTIPVFKSTQEAQTFGRLFPESRQALRNERAYYLRKARREQREGSERVWATLLQAQFVREALEVMG